MILYYLESFPELWVSSYFLLVFLGENYILYFYNFFSPIRGKDFYLGEGFQICLELFQLTRELFKLSFRQFISFFFKLLRVELSLLDCSNTRSSSHDRLRMISVVSLKIILLYSYKQDLGRNRFSAAHGGFSGIMGRH